jgi:hypothetical protein
LRVDFVDEGRYAPGVSTVEEIGKVIKMPPKEEFWKLAEWFNERREEVWDHEIEMDARPGGPLDKLAKQALKEIDAGETVPLDEFLRNP